MNNIQSSDRKQDYVVYTLLLIVSAVFLLIFSKGSSPLFDGSFYGYDGPIFMVLGQSFLDGKVPYVDFFDHKGPVIIFIEALGQLFVSGRNGIFLLQIVNMFFILLFVYKTASLFAFSLMQKAVIVLSFLLFFSLSIDEDNLTEEYSLLYLVVAVYLTFHFYFIDLKISILNTVALALCFQFPFWMRANNSGLVCACFCLAVY